MQHKKVAVKPGFLALTAASQTPDQCNCVSTLLNNEARWKKKRTPGYANGANRSSWARLFNAQKKKLYSLI
jgi:hypothetical protein